MQVEITAGDDREVLATFLKTATQLRKKLPTAQAATANKVELMFSKALEEFDAKHAQPALFPEEGR